VPGEASWELADLLAAKPQLAGRLAAAVDLETALASASAAARGAPLVVAGSLYLLGALLASGAAAPEAAGDGETPPD
jgi:folylpolyglutamate synthase/dihydropteroate synthase